jgi:methionyl-tRNA formyltransferase
MQQAILSGDEKTGVTIMRMEEGLDSGDMLARAETLIGDKNFEMIHDELADMGAALMAETLSRIERGEVDFVPQDESQVTYARKITKQDGKIDFREGAEAVLRKIRAFDPWPGAFCEMEGKTIKLWNGYVAEGHTDVEDGHIVSVDKHVFCVAAGGKLLAVTELQLPGKKRTRTEDFLRGHALTTDTVLT